MRINSIFATEFRPSDLESLKKIKLMAPSWGSSKSWSWCQTDNVICNEISEVRSLLRRQIQTSCNFYVPNDFYQLLERPLGLKFYQGNITEAVKDIEDIIAMHLVSDQSDLILMFGFDLSNPGVIEDQYELHRTRNRFGLIRQAIASNPNTQWVMIDHPKSPDLAFQSLANLTCDSFSNMLKLLGE